MNLPIHSAGKKQGNFGTKRVGDTNSTPINHLAVTALAIMKPTFKLPLLRTCAALFLNTLALSATVQAQTTYQHIGNTTLASDGRSYHQIGTTTIGSDGSFYNRIGSTTTTNDGRSYHQIGNTTIGSDGTTAHRIGDTTIINGPRGSTSCQIIGQTVVCN